MSEKTFNAQAPGREPVIISKIKPLLTNKLILKTFAPSRLCAVALIFISFFSACQKPPVEKPKPISKVATLSGTGEKIGEPFGVAVKTDEVYVSDGENGKILKISKDGTASVFTDKLDTPSQIAFDQNGDLIVADSGSHTIKRIKPTGEIESIAGTENQSGFADGDARAALFNAPVGVAVSGNKIFVADTYNDKIRVIENGRVSTLAGSVQGFADGAGNQARFDTPCGVAATADGKLIVADLNNRRLRAIERDGTTRTLAGNGNWDLVDGSLAEAVLAQPSAVSIDKTGAIYFTDGNAIRVIENRIFPLVKTISNARRGFTDGSPHDARFNRP